MEIMDLPIIFRPSKPRYQIFTSGLAARHTFLLDTEFGKTWVLVHGTRQRPDGSEYQVNLWEPFVE